jgi:AraC-like DNA-binding protein
MRKQNKMSNKQIKDSDFELAKKWANDKFIEDDIIILDNVGEAPIPNEPRRMSFIFVAMCTKGQAQYRLDTQNQVVKKNDIILISDHHVVDNYTASPDLEGVGMMISPKFFYEIVRNVSDISSLILFSRNHPVVSLTEQETETFLDYFYLMKKRITDKTNHFRKNFTSTLLLAMFYDLSNVIYRVQQMSDTRKTRADAIFTNFIHLVEENYKQERRVGWYAEQLCITPKYLSETVKCASKRTPNDWIDNYVIMEVRVMLKNTTKSIKEIAMDLNFPNQSFLGKYFKEHVGMSPSNYRKS